MAKILTLAHERPARMSKKFREVLRLHEIEGMSVTDACAKVDYSRAAYYKARKNPAAQDLIRELRKDFIDTVEVRKAFLKGKALDVALELLLTSKSEAIRARMVEFLASDAKVSPVAVHIDARQSEPAAGYIYTRPGQVIEGMPGDEAANS